MTKEEIISELKYKRSRLIKSLSEREYEVYSRSIEALENQKTGHWIEHGTMRTYHRYKCSVCGGKRTGETGDWIQIHECKYPYCPDCGAKMEGE